MNAKRDREELLGSFVDGELTHRQAEEIRHLAEQDPAVRQRINELENLQGLLRALPRLEAPPGLNDQLKALLMRNARLGNKNAAPVSSPGPRHVLLRRVRAVAAIVGIVIALAALIHLTWDSSEPGLPSAGRLEVPSTAPAGQARSGAMVARLELDVASFSTVDVVMNRAIEHNGLSPYTDKTVEGKAKVYRIRSSRQAVTAFLEDFSPAWSQFERASLRLVTEDFGNPLVLEMLSAVQMLEIFQRESAGQSVDLARRLAVQNSMERLRVADRLEKLTHEHLDLVAARVPNPMLTSRESATSPPTDPSSAGGEVTELTIILRPAKD